MSYCRTGWDSDLYLYRSGDAWHFHFSKEDQEPICHHSVDSIEEACDLALDLRKAGIRVPQYAMDRLFRERAKQPCPHKDTIPVGDTSVRFCLDCKAVLPSQAE